jgi:hypothetical protein
MGKLKNADGRRQFNMRYILFSNALELKNHFSEVEGVFVADRDFPATFPCFGMHHADYAGGTTMSFLTAADIKRMAFALCAEE